MAVEAWVTFFTELLQLLESSERNLGISNGNFCEYMVERLEISIQSCTNLSILLQSPSVALSNEELDDINEYTTQVNDLLTYLKASLEKWKDYMAVLESTSIVRQTMSYQVCVIHNGRRGRPRFDVTREQIEYLFSLSFHWNEIADLLCISRMTLYRY